MITTPQVNVGIESGSFGINNPDTNRIDSIRNTPEGKAELEAYINSVKWTRENFKDYPARWEKCTLRKTREEMK